MQTTELTRIPLTKLFRSALNVRHVVDDKALKGLAENIAEYGLVQNLVVTPEGKGKKAGFGVVAGGRRLAALLSLVEAGRMDKAFEIPCRLVGVDEATAISLSENQQHQQMHPADQVAGFAMLVDQGKTQVDIARLFGLPKMHVKRVLAMGNLSPLVLQAYREDKLNTAQIEALTLTTDHATQEAFLTGNANAWSIRNRLSEGTVTEDDQRVKLVGIKAYRAAGGEVSTDLFQSGTTYYKSPEILEKLAVEKLQAHAAANFPGAAWVEVYAERMDHSIRSKYKAVPTIKREATADELANIQALAAAAGAAQEALCKIEADESVTEEQYSAVSEAAEEAEGAVILARNALFVLHPDAAALAGVVLAISHEGEPVVIENVLREADADALARGGAAGAEDGAQAEAGSKGDIDPTSVRTDLTTLLTAVTQEAVAANPGLALRLMAFRLWANMTHHYERLGSGLSLTANDRYKSETLAAHPVQEQREARAVRWESVAKMKQDEAQAYFLAAGDDTVQEWLAYCMALSLSGIQIHAGNQPLAPVIKAAGIDMRKHWTPNAAYFTRIRKRDTLALLTSQGHSVEGLGKLKRPELAERAAGLLADSGWLAPSLAPALAD